MSEGIVLKGDSENWYCSCGTQNSSEDRHCDNCEGKREEKDDAEIPSLTENMNFKFPKRIIPY